MSRTPPDTLGADEIERALEDLPEWSLRDGKLHREYVFADFVEAFGFMSAAALCAERADHHPEWSNVYKRVSVDLVTHESAGVTQRDVDLALEFDRAARR